MNREIEGHHRLRLRPEEGGVIEQVDSVEELDASIEVVYQDPDEDANEQFRQHANANRKSLRLARAIERYRNTDAPVREGIIGRALEISSRIEDKVPNPLYRHGSYFEASTSEDEDDEEGDAEESLERDESDEDDEEEDDGQGDFPLLDDSGAANIQGIPPDAQARLEAFFEAADGKLMNDPENLRKLTLTVSSALGEASAAINRMRDSQRKSMEDGRNDSMEEGDSLLALACSSGYFELARVLLAMGANVDDRGSKGDLTPLMDATSQGHLEIVKLLLVNKADVNAQSSCGNSPLMYACAAGHEEIVKELLSGGARLEDNNENGHTPLMEAASAGHVNVAKILLRCGAGINTHSNEFKESALTVACYKGHYDMVRFLLEAGADQQHKTDEMHTALMEASMDGHVEVARLLLDSGAQVNMPAESFESPLTLAACGGHVELAELLIERGANIEEVNDEGYTPLMEASREGHLSVVKCLLESGAKINALTDESHETALTLAACGGFLDVVDTLCSSGADIELGASTPLMEAAQEGHYPIVKYLLDRRADISRETQTGDTAFSYACENGHTDVVELLFEGGADFEHLSEGGRSPLMKACRGGHVEVITFLLGKKADVNRETANNDHTPLSLACAGGHTAAVEELLAAGADPYHKLKDNSTMVIEASRGGHTGVIKILMDYATKKNDDKESNNNEASGSGGGKIKAGSKVNINNQGKSMLRKSRSTSTLDSKSNDGGVTEVKSKKGSCAPSEKAKEPAIKVCKPLGEGKCQQQASASSAINTTDVNNAGSHSIPTVNESNIKMKVASTEHSKPVTRKNVSGSSIPPGSVCVECANAQKLHANVKRPATSNEASVTRAAAAVGNLSSHIPLPSSGNTGVAISNPVSASQTVSAASCTPGSSGPPLVPSQVTAATAISERPKAKANKPSARKLHQIHQLQQMQVQQQLNIASSSAASMAGVAIMDKMASPMQNLGNLTSSSSIICSDSCDTIKMNVVAESLSRNVGIPPATIANVTSPFLHSQAKTIGNQSQCPNVLSAESGILTSESFDCGSMNDIYQILEATDKLKVSSPAGPSGIASVGMIPPVALTMTEVANSMVMSPTSLSFTQCSGATTTTTTTVVVTHGNGSTETIVEEGVQLQAIPSLAGLAEANLATTGVATAGMPGNISSVTDLNHPTMKELIEEISSPIITVGKPIGSQEREPKVATSVPSSSSPSSTSLSSSSSTSSSSSISDSSKDLSMKQNVVHTHGIGSDDVAIPRSSFVPPSVAHYANSLPKKHLVKRSRHCMSQAVCAIPGPSSCQGSGPRQSNQQTQTHAHHPVRNGHAHPHGHNHPHSHSHSVASQTQNDKNEKSNARKPTSPLDLDSATESNGETSLSIAAAAGHYDVVEYLLSQNAKIEHRDKKGYTPLILAADGGHDKVVELLIDQGAEIEAQSERTKDTALSLACTRGKLDVVTTLLEKGANIEHRNVSDYTPLSLAASGGYVSIIKHLLKKGAEINSRTGSKLGISPLMLAAMNGNTSAVKLLLDMGSDINAQIETNKNTALTLACFQGRQEVVSLLIDRKANIEHRAKTGLTPLMEAANGGYTEVGRILLDKGAEVNAAPVAATRDTALTIAADKGHYKFVELLLNRGAIVDAKNKKGCTSLWLACNGGHLDVCQILFRHGADLDAQDNRKLTCLMAAYRRGHVRVIRWIVKNVQQFPSDAEMTRYLLSIQLEPELLNRCEQCSGHISQAKEKQALEANKNASSLLEELDQEKSREENKKLAAQRRREKKKRKKQEKRQQQTGCVKDDDEYDDDEDEEEVNVDMIGFDEKNDNVYWTLNDVKPESAKPSKDQTISTCKPLVVKDKESLIGNKKGKAQEKENIKQTLPVSSVSSQSNNTSSKMTETGPSKPCNVNSSMNVNNGKSATTVESTLKDGKNHTNNKSNKKKKSKQNIHENVIKQERQLSEKENQQTVTTNASSNVNKSSKTEIHQSTSRNTKEKEIKKLLQSVKDKEKDKIAENVSFSVSEGKMISSKTVQQQSACKKDKKGTQPTQTSKGQKEKEDTGGFHHIGPGVTSNSKAQSLTKKAAKSADPVAVANGPEPLMGISLNPQQLRKQVHDNYLPSSSTNNSDVFTSANGSSSTAANVVASKVAPSNRKEEGWKEVTRSCPSSRSKKVIVDASAISRVIGRAGCNINAIREATGAHIEVEKQSKSQPQLARTIQIKGSADSVKQAHELITKLIHEHEVDLKKYLTNKVSSSGPTVESNLRSQAGSTPTLATGSIPYFSTADLVKSNGNIKSASSAFGGSTNATKPNQVKGSPTPKSVTVTSTSPSLTTKNSPPIRKPAVLSSVPNIVAHSGNGNGKRLQSGEFVSNTLCSLPSTHVSVAPPTNVLNNGGGSTVATVVTSASFASKLAHGPFASTTAATTNCLNQINNNSINVVETCNEAIKVTSAPSSVTPTPTPIVGVSAPPSPTPPLVLSSSSVSQTKGTETLVETSGIDRNVCSQQFNSSISMSTSSVYTSSHNQLNMTPSIERPSKIRQPYQNDMFENDTSAFPEVQHPKNLAPGSNLSSVITSKPSSVERNDEQPATVQPQVSEPPEYSPFNYRFTQTAGWRTEDFATNAALGQVSEPSSQKPSSAVRSMNFASAAASRIAVSTMNGPNPTLNGPSTSVEMSHGKISLVEEKENEGSNPDASKAPGYRGNGTASPSAVHRMCPPTVNSAPSVANLDNTGIFTLGMRPSISSTNPTDFFHPARSQMMRPTSTDQFTQENYAVNSMFNVSGQQNLMYPNNGGVIHSTSVVPTSVVLSSRLNPRARSFTSSVLGQQNGQFPQQPQQQQQQPQPNASQFHLSNQFKNMAPTLGFHNSLGMGLTGGTNNSAQTGRPNIPQNNIGMQMGMAALANSDLSASGMEMRNLAVSGSAAGGLPDIHAYYQNCDIGPHHDAQKNEDRRLPRPIGVERTVRNNRLNQYQSVGELDNPIHDLGMLGSGQNPSSAHTNQFMNVGAMYSGSNPSPQVNFPSASQPSMNNINAQVPPRNDVGNMLGRRLVDEDQRPLEYLQCDPQRLPNGGAMMPPMVQMNTPQHHIFPFSIENMEQPQQHQQPQQNMHNLTTKLEHYNSWDPNVLINENLPVNVNWGGTGKW